ncbi:Rha family transcriptional regulator [Providencia rettgeri]|uniref:Rha family transcriptional regulator n=1 Tax=Morganellaceae TaxID=1903414 RepID=UPI0019D43680|nr:MULTISPECIES: Rha family transcriptional regulator [Morganellaceae]EKX9133121.1 Rha family transcriptional regulator [Proteus mirabilis]MBN7840128.1 Rha family transcriptional regulator [Providencia rettgeri]MBN7853052.1 Rha family transcriptional regulator [Providencia rettgeri]MBN7861139.1 Rha family transcriptional regulator [Providencia rettgeri]MBN7871396.1 Rha family transcriptional regulator [Providencia rettgeri]
MKLEKNSLIADGFAHPEINQESILVQHRTEPRIDSRLFAARIGIKHKNLFELVKKNAKNLRQFGTLPFQTETCSHSTGASINKYALLNESQFDFMCRIVRGRNHEQMTQFKLDVTKAFSKKRAAEPIRREYLPHYHESRDALRDLGAEKHHFINLARTENRLTGLLTGERASADEQQLGLLVCMQKIEQAAFQDAIDSGLSATQALREVSKRIEQFASLMSPTVRIGG